MKDQIQLFGGNWTEEKLKILRKYLQAYVSALKNQPFNLLYIDAFAGTGYREKKKDCNKNELFYYTKDTEQDQFLEGSASIALNIQPSFFKYIFIEANKKRCDELKKLRNMFPLLSKNIIIKNKEANKCLIELCRIIDWNKHRAVLFLDPFGMEVHWQTIVAIARTKSIDLWYLFPLGVGVNRLLKRDGKISDTLKNKLNLIFGTEGWYNEFYNIYKETGLFGEIEVTKKAANFNLIANYIIKRLESIFPYVAKNPKQLYNSKNIPLYLFCFATSNPDPKAINLSKKIAEHILKGW